MTTTLTAFRKQLIDTAKTKNSLICAQNAEIKLNNI